MMELLHRLGQEAGDALAAQRPKAFAAAVDGFTFALQRLPDYPAAAMSNEAFARVNAFAEQVISEIEHRLDGDIDAKYRETLSERVYDIRRALEDAFTWRRHYLRT
ncbi:MAG TPA: hypothetical protein VFB07_10940 [Vicinamibacterales bacterium]|nr:hypothetical protein [Vicinamibacterales bacterium]